MIEGDSKEYEVFDIMPNGQLRFAIYGLDGKLKTAADEVYSLAADMGGMGL